MDNTDAFFGRELYNQAVVWWAKDRNPQMALRELTVLINHFRSDEVFGKIGKKVAPDTDFEGFKSLYFASALLCGEAEVQKATWKILDEMRCVTVSLKNNRVLLKEFFDARRWPWNWNTASKSKCEMTVWLNMWPTIRANDCGHLNKKRGEYITLFLEHHPHAGPWTKVPLTKEFVLKVELLNSPHGNRLTYKQFVSFFGEGEMLHSDTCTYATMDEVKEKICEHAIKKVTALPE